MAAFVLRRKGTQGCSMVINMATSPGELHIFERLDPFGDYEIASSEIGCMADFNLKEILTTFLCETISKHDKKLNRKIYNSIEFDIVYECCNKDFTNQQ